MEENFKSLLEEMVPASDNILWKGKPSKLAYVVNRSLSLLGICVIWLGMGAFFISQVLSIADDMELYVKLIMLGFILIWMSPVWFFLAKMITASAHWKNTEYVITDKRIFIQTGLGEQTINTLMYKEISAVSLHTSILDRFFKVGDIKITTADKEYSLLDLSESTELFKQVQHIVMDIQTDIYYPNALRPDNNPGYNTRYPK